MEAETPREWHYLKGGRPYGPVPEASIAAWLESGFLTPTDLLWRYGLPDWMPISELPEFGGRAWPRSGSGTSSLAGGATTGEGGATTGEAGAPARPGPDFARDVARPAGFWLRLGAYLLDSFLLSIVLVVVWSPRLKHLPPATDFFQMYEAMAKDQTLVLTVFFLTLAYSVLFEASPLKATLGKRAFRLRVEDLEGRRLTYPRALLRNLGKILSSIPFYGGFLVAAFTPRKQALHDLIARCLVVRDD